MLTKGNQIKLGGQFNSGGSSSGSGGAGTAWEISAVQSLKEFSVGSQATVPSAIRYGDSGTKMYIGDQGTNKVFQYTLSTAYDPSTASYDSKSLDTTAQVTNFFFDFTINEAGTILYALSGNNDSIYQYTLSTAWDVSTATYASKSLSVNAEDGIPQAIWLNATGTRLFMTGSGTNTLYSYTLSTPTDISSGTYDSKSYVIGGNRKSVSLDPTGKYIYTLQVNGTITSWVDQHEMSTPYDLSTASSANRIVGTFYKGDDTLTGFDFRSNGKSFTIVGLDDDKVHQINIAD